jgi:hypothetical protein
MDWLTNGIDMPVLVILLILAVTLFGPRALHRR